MFILRPSLTLNFGFVLGLWVLLYGANEIIIKLRIKPREKKKKDFAWEIVQGKRQQNLGFLYKGFCKAHKSKRICETWINIVK